MEKLAAPRAVVFKDGEWLGEGPDAVSKVFRDECDGGDTVERVTGRKGIGWREFAELHIHEVRA